MSNQAPRTAVELLVEFHERLAFNLRDPRIYVASGYRNQEWIDLRAFFLSPPHRPLPYDCPFCERLYGHRPSCTTHHPECGDLELQEAGHGPQD
jgi:hypothetical protein